MRISQRNKTELFELSQDWLNTRLGKDLLLQEIDLVKDILEGMFGEVSLQLGLWGEQDTFLRYSRTQSAVSISDNLFEKQIGEFGAVSKFYQIPVNNRTADVIFLPHTLDFGGNHVHAILREVERVMTASGHLIILGFRPISLWGLRSIIFTNNYSPVSESSVSEGRLKDWLELLGMRIINLKRYYFRLPLDIDYQPFSINWEGLGRRYWPILSSCYMLVAQKKIATITPIRNRWESRRKVVGGFVEPST